MKKIRFAVIGLGRMGRDHIGEMQSFPDCFELEAVCDSAPDRLENLPENMNVKKKYSSLEALLKDSCVDLVTIATRHPEHVPMAINILESGKYCVVEKPVATSLAEFNELKKCALQHPGKLFFRHNRRFEGAFIKAKELADSGAFGEIQVIKLDRSVGFCRRNDWMTMPEYYGGLLSNWGPHLIDQALRFLDSPVTDIWADVRNIVSIGKGDDFFKILLKSENGRVADIEVTGANTMAAEREIEIICKRGTIIHKGDGKIRVRAIDPSTKLYTGKAHPENPPFRYGNFDETLQFVESVYDPSPTDTSVMWKLIYLDITEGVPYPVKHEEAEEVVRVTEEVFRKSRFNVFPEIFTRTN